MQLDARENDQKTARIGSWRQRLQTSTREVFQWLARDGVTMPTDSLNHNGQPLTGDTLHGHVADFWKQVWPATNLEAQQMRQQQAEHLNRAAIPGPLTVRVLTYHLSHPKLFGIPFKKCRIKQ